MTTNSNSNKTIKDNGCINLIWCPKCINSVVYNLIRLYDITIIIIYYHNHFVSNTHIMDKIKVDTWILKIAIDWHPCQLSVAFNFETLFNIS